MFSDSDLKDLVSFASPAPVLSLYMHTDPTERNAETFKLRLRSILKNVDLDKDVEEVERFFNHEYDWNGQGVAVFSSQPQQFWREFSFALPLPERAVVSNCPTVKPLANLLETYGGYGIAIVNHQHARLFLFHLGELTVGPVFNGEEIKHTKSGGASTVSGMRGGMTGQTQYSEEMIDRNLKQSAEIAVAFFTENHVRRILVGGGASDVSLFRSYLPKSMQSLVQGMISIGKNFDTAKLQVRVLELCREAEQKKETKFLDDFLTAAAKKNNAVAGVSETLDMVNNNRVRTIITLAGMQLSGQHCPNCGLITTQALERCPTCNHRLEQIPDAVDYAIRQVLQKGGDVETIATSPELEKAGSIGALLRY